MKLKKKELLETLNNVNLAMFNKGIAKEISDFIFYKNKICTTNGDTCGIANFEADNCYGCVPSDELLKIVNKIDNDIVDITFDEVEISLKGIDIESALILSDESSIIDDLDSFLSLYDKCSNWVNLPTNFCDVLEMAYFTVSKDISDVLSCIYVNDDIAISSDNLRIGKYKLKSSINDNFLLQSKYINNLILFNPISYCRKDSVIFFKNEANNIFSFILFDGEYEDFERFFDFEGTRVIVNDSLSDLVDSAEILSDEQFDLDRKILIEMAPKEVICKGEGKKGWIKHKKNFNTKLKSAISFMVNPMYFKQILKDAKYAKVGDDKILFVCETYQYLLSVYSE